MEAVQKAEYTVVGHTLEVVWVAGPPACICNQRRPVPQSDFPPASSVACELGTNFEGRSEAALSRSSGGAVSAGASAAERDDASATDHWSMQASLYNRPFSCCPASQFMFAARMPFTHEGHLLGSSMAG